MARLALGAVGAVIGAPFGLSGLGFALGSTLGGFLFPPDPIVQEGPRLGDLSVTSSTYGKAIPIAYASSRMAGNVIWSAGIREEKNKKSSGGGKGGGPKQTQITYTYYSSFAVALAEGPAADVTRIWADSKLIYDRTGSENIQKSELVFRFYPGDEEQLPDPLIEEDVGETQAPAHRGLCYIVFDDLPLADYGNRIPNITAEVAFATESANSVAYSDKPLEGPVSGGSISVDRKRRRVYVKYNPGGGNPHTIESYNYDNLKQIRRTELALFNGEAPFSSELFCGRVSGTLYTSIQSSGGLAPYSVAFINPDTLQVTKISDSGTNMAINSTCPLIEVPFGRDSKFIVFRESTGAGHLTLLRETTLLARNFSSGTISGEIVGMAAGDGGEQGLFWVCSATLDGSSRVDEVFLWRVIVSPEYAYIDPQTGTIFGQPFIEQVASFTQADTWGALARAGEAQFTVMGPVLDETDGGIVVAIELDKGDSAVWKWVEGEGVAWASEVEPRLEGRSMWMSMNAEIKNGLFGFMDDSTGAAGKVGCLIDTRTGRVLEAGVSAQAIDNRFTPSGLQFFDEATQSVTCLGSADLPEVGILHRLYMGRVSTKAATVGDIVADISERAGLDPATDIDVSELTDTVRGYVLSRQLSGREAIQPLGTAFAFDGVESDDKIVFKRRGRSPTRTIDRDSLLVIEDDSADVLQETRAQEVELPERLTVNYSDSERDYQQGSASAKRIRSPASTMQSRNEQSMTLPMVLTPTEAAQMAERLLYTMWSERTSHKWRAPWEHLDLDPADVVDLTVGSATLRARLLRADINVDFTLSMESVAESAVVVVSESVGQGGLGLPQKVPPGPLFTRLFMLDIPLLRDQDDNGRRAARLHFAMNGYQESWQSGTLWEATGPSGVSFNTTGLRALDGVVHGAVANKLPDTELPFQTDTETVLEVVLNVGELSSVTQEEFLNNTNMALIGDPATQNWEVVAFKSAVQQASGSYEVSTLLRGRRGTEHMVGTHSAGEVFLLLEPETINSLLLDIGQLDSEQVYRGVGVDQIVENADSVSVTPTGADLMPYAPAHLAAALDGSDNIDLEWVRRTRVGGALRDGHGTVPLSEDSEAYEVDIKDGPAGTVLRTLSSTDPSVQYDNADVVADFGSVPSSVTFEVFQLSAQVGRGHGTERTVTL